MYLHSTSRPRLNALKNQSGQKPKSFRLDSVREQSTLETQMAAREDFQSFGKSYAGVLDWGSPPFLRLFVFPGLAFPVQ